MMGYATRIKGAAAVVAMTLAALPMAAAIIRSLIERIEVCAGEAR